MRKFHIVVLMFLAGVLSGGILQAQEIGDVKEYVTNKLLIDSLRFDFAVPDAPAFSLLGTDPSNILRPNSARKLAVGLSDFLGSDNAVVLPKSFAVEFSPALLIAGKTLTVADYSKRAWMYRTRLSGATHRPEGGSSATKVAIGVRMTLIDDSDLRTQMDYISDATGAAERINDIQVAARRRAGPPPAALKLTTEEEKQVEEIISSLYKKWNLKTKEKAEDEKWNRHILELAVAASAGSPDSLGKNLRMDNVTGWGTYGHPFGTWGQLLIGVNIASQKDSLGASGGFENSGNLSTRLYIGTNQYKVFVEGQASAKDEVKANYLFNGGGEIKLSGNIWLVFSAGTEYVGSTKKTGLVTDFKLKLGL